MKDYSRASILLVLAASLATPFLAFAQTGINMTAIKSYSDNIILLINNVVVPVLFAVAFLYFIYGVYKYFILGADNDTERGTGRQFVLWSVIGFAVILSVWGLVAVVGNTFGLTPGGTPPSYPTL